MVTGAGGNLGRKVAEALAQQPWCRKVIGVDIKAATDQQQRPGSVLQYISSDLTRRDASWVDCLDEVDAVIHFAALNPLPDATWDEAFTSYDMTQNLLLEIAKRPIRRFVFASSNHAMGAYKDEPLAQKIGPGKLTTDLPPAPGTRWHDGSREVHSLAYGTSKVMGEKLCAAVAELSQGQLSTVAVRVGWALTGDNDPRDITHSGSPASSAGAQELNADAQRALRWFRNMWLSNRDLTALFAAALQADQRNWPAPSIIVNGVSDNQGMDWDLQSAREWLGYQPRDNAYLSINA